jgi:hypothetical protein
LGKKNKTKRNTNPETDKSRRARTGKALISFSEQENKKSTISNTENTAEYEGKFST